MISNVHRVLAAAKAMLQWCTRTWLLDAVQSGLAAVCGIGTRACTLREAGEGRLVVKAPLERLAAATATLTAQPGVHWVTLHSSPRAANFYGTAITQCGAAESTYDVANLYNGSYPYNDQAKHPLWAAGIRVSLHVHTDAHQANILNSTKFDQRHDSHPIQPLVTLKMSWMDGAVCFSVQGLGQILAMGDTGMDLDSCFFRDTSIPPISTGNWPNDSTGEWFSITYHLSSSCPNSHPSGCSGCNASMPDKRPQLRYDGHVSDRGVLM